VEGSLRSAFPADIFTEPEEIDPDTMKNLGPLTPMAGVWEGSPGLDVHPVAEGSEDDRYVERYELHPIDPQANGPQVLYGLRYWTTILRPDEPETFHDQVGYWLWEPPTGMILLSLSIPRGQIAMAMGYAASDARSFELECRLGSPINGTCSNPFLDHALKTTEYRIKVDIHDDGTWSYEQDTLLQIIGQPQPFHHTDRNRLRKVGEPKPNWLMRNAKRA
jgi:hypothetical protein